MPFKVSERTTRLTLQSNEPVSVAQFRERWAAYVQETVGGREGAEARVKTSELFRQALTQSFNASEWSAIVALAHPEAIEAQRRLGMTDEQVVCEAFNLHMLDGESYAEKLAQVEAIELEPSPRPAADGRVTLTGSARLRDGSSHPVSLAGAVGSLRYAILPALGRRVG